ncbi:DUF427 domain protein [Trichodelitschia bisporula]|uniref:DUF427 domain protein n=1 Tax=Trichodelitschia bisporula TaxID=703511 RepID=A0A6G1HNL6_9PEZI|nr:DUF427 domain protein [Trichodelitschia bisporula]
MPHATASLNGQTIASTDTYQVVEGNVYFPPSALKSEFYTKTDTHTHCPWKGDASYYTVAVGDAVREDAAWYYPEVITERAKPLRGWVAFCELW